MLYLKNEKKMKLMKIIELEKIKIKKIFKKILEDYDDIFSKKAYDIKNYIIIEYTIRLINKILIVGK